MSPAQHPSNSRLFGLPTLVQVHPSSLDQAFSGPMLKFQLSWPAGVPQFTPPAQKPATQRLNGEHRRVFLSRSLYGKHEEFNLFTAICHFHKQPPWWPTFFGDVISDFEGRDGSFIVRRTRSAIPRDQKVTQSRHMVAPKLRFSRGLKVKAPGAVTACVPAPTPLVKIFTGPATERKKQRW